MCCPTTRQICVKSRLVCVAKVTPVRTTTIAKTGGVVHTNTNTGTKHAHIHLYTHTGHTTCLKYIFFFYLCPKNNTKVCGVSLSPSRALPCPAVKHSEEWGDPSKCEVAEGCQYCHTRTEQQFHPEVCDAVCPNFRNMLLVSNYNYVIRLYHWQICAKVRVSYICLTQIRTLY